MKSSTVLGSSLFFNLGWLAVSTVVINEVSDKGTTGQCQAQDWIELFNSGDTDVSLAGFVLHDDRDPTHQNVFTFPSDASIAAGAYHTLCCKSIDGPLFAIGGARARVHVGGYDSVTLRDSAGAVVSTTGQLLNYGGLDITWARKDDGSYAYTTTPTFGAVNVFTGENVATMEESKAKNLEELKAQNALGTSFFGMDENGLHVEHETVVDFKVTMKEANRQYMIKNQSYEVYSDVEKFEVVEGNVMVTKVTATLGKGRIRPRGQSTLAFGTCFNIPAIPFSRGLRLL
jgi:hypothetical protein